jgi:hypothetical protein
MRKSCPAAAKLQGIFNLCKKYLNVYFMMIWKFQRIIANVVLWTLIFKGMDYLRKNKNSRTLTDVKLLYN